MMNDAKRLFFNSKVVVMAFAITITFVLLPMPMSLKAQVPLPSHNSKYDQSVKNQRHVDEQLARNFFNNKEYDKAADLYQRLYINYHYYYYFQQYIECLIFLESFDAAKKDLRSFIKNDNTVNKWRSNVTLAYVLFRNNENDKSDKVLKKMINELPADRNQIGRAHV